MYIWHSGCRDGGDILTAGAGPLAGFHTGQRVTARVVPAHFAGPAAWEVRAFGR